ncbi:MAG: AMP-binding protein [Lentisphaeria bacterium]
MQKFLQNLAQFGDKLAIICNDKAYSYRWLTDRIAELRTEYDRAGIPDQAVTVLETDFSGDGIAAFFALAQKQCIIVPLASGHGSEKARLAAIAQAEFIIRTGNGTEPDSIDHAGTATHPHYGTLRERRNPGLVLFSSGSTGDPKAVVHDLSLLAERFSQPRKPYRAIAFLLFDHIGGINTMLYLLASGGCLVVVPDRTPGTVLKAVESHQVELLPASPTFLNMILAGESYKEYDLSSLKVISYGSEPMAENTLHKIHEILPQVRLQQTYGLSEVGILSTKSKSSDSLWLKAGGEGYETKIIDDILYIRAQTAMLGYLNAPSPFTEDGWFNTGDAVEVDGDYIRFLGRQDAQINVGGEKVSPPEVESVLEEMDEVQQAVVFGEKNPLTGAVVSARIVPAKKAPSEPAALRRAVRQHCEARLARYKVPVRIEIEATIQPTERFKKKRP